jgi:Phytanoyl-CoA dioxygenase (PhyH)
MALDAGQVQDYHDRGFVSPIPALAGEEVMRFRRDFEELERFHGDSLRIEHLKFLHLFFPWAYELAVHPTVLDAVESLLGPDLLIHSSSAFYKEPEGEEFVSWHQDGYYYRLSEPKLVTAWIALTDSSVENGCMRVIPGSHKRLEPHENSTNPDNQLTLAIVGEVDESRAVDITLDPGEFSAHHVNLVHGSGLNRSGGKRIGYAVRYTTPEVSQELVHLPVMVARGQDDRLYYGPGAEPPSGSLVECASRQAEAHREYMRRRNEQTSQAARRPR